MIVNKTIKKIKKENWDWWKGYCYSKGKELGECFNDMIEKMRKNPKLCP